MSRLASYTAHLRAALSLGVPLIGSHVAQFAISLTDAVMLGWYAVEALAAETLAHAMFFTLFIMGSGFAWAVMPMVAAAAGAGDETQVRRVTRMGLWISALFGVVGLAPMMVSAPLFRAAGQQAETAALAESYLQIAGVGLVPALLVMVLKSYLAALGRARAVLWVTLAALALNVAVNWVLIFGRLGAPELGIRGAALASLAVHLGSLAALVGYAARRFPAHALFRRLWRPDGEAFGRVFRLGWPIGITNLAEVGLFSASSVMMGLLGTLPLAAHGIALQITGAVFMVHLGLSNVATIRAGAAHGRNDRRALRDGGVVVTGLSMAVALATVALFLAVPEALLGLFVDPDDPARPEVLAIGAALLAAAALFQVVDAAQVMALGLLRGVQDTRVPMLFAAVSYWLVGMPVSYALGFPLGLGGVGVWLGLAAGLGLAGVLMMTRFWRRAVHLAPSAAREPVA